MNLSKLMLIFLMALTTACSPTDSEVLYWVNSLRVDCVGIAPMSCLQVQEGSLGQSEVLKQGDWQLFYGSIDGFSYQAGYVYKLILKKENLPLEQVPADGSSIKYSLVKVLEKTADARLRLNDIWALESIQGEILVLDSDSPRPQLEIHLRDMRVIGNDGCNDFFTGIEALNSEEITFGPIAGTRKYCRGMNIPDRFNQQLNKVTAYKLKDLRLHFLDSEGEELLVFRKID